MLFVGMKGLLREADVIGIITRDVWFTPLGRLYPIVRPEINGRNEKLGKGIFVEILGQLFSPEIITRENTRILIIVCGKVADVEHAVD